MGAEQRDGDEWRMLKRLAGRGGKLTVGEDGVCRLARAGKRGGRVNSVAAATIQSLAARGLITASADGGWVATDLGRTHVKRGLAVAADPAAQRQDRGAVTLNDETLGTVTVTVNHDESPLSWLRRRRGRDGRPLIDAAAFAAGERLRADYTRALIMPRVTANWTAAVAGRRRDGAGGMAELTEAAIAARRRVAKALAAVGPEFDGLLVDLCCFLKGLEEIERERRWPARSAKVVVKMGLARLARHYGLTAGARGPERSGAFRHWGTDDYRPT